MQDNNKVDILGVRVDNFNKRELIGKIQEFLAGKNFCQIATVNPEFVLAAQKDEEFRNILNGADLNAADGVGIKFAFLWYGKILKKRIAGADLMMEILKIADEKKMKIFLAANSGGLSSYEEVARAIKNIYPEIELGGINLDNQISNFQFSISNQILNSKFQIQNSDIVFCNFGAPHQEKFLHSLKSLKDSKIKLVMGVGGSFDFLTGKIKRAPKIMRSIGMEWLWRFFQEPKYRAKRIFKAAIIFPIRILLTK
ncbi:MAG TPA: hypothetical protein DIT25_00210 [Candidatus Moranbacteria bacterium]|nr:hypothetical protein [Candidatus Moranbacteria bacterium]